ncbi:hypothetical protein ACFQ2B_12335 [Streptomyces stramineus]
MTSSASPPRTTSGWPRWPRRAPTRRRGPGGSPSTGPASATPASRPTAGTSPTPAGAASTPRSTWHPSRAGPPAHLLGQQRRPGLRLVAARPGRAQRHPRRLLARPALLVLLLGVPAAHRRQPRRPAPWGPVSDLAIRGSDGKTLLLTGKPPHEPASWKRYRGGATGRLWLHGTRLVPDLGGHLDSVMCVGDRIAFLSDHEGVGNLYSCLPDSSDLRRTPTTTTSTPATPPPTARASSTSARANCGWSTTSGPMPGRGA